MAILTENLFNSQNVRVEVTYNTANPDNITKATCVNSNPFPVTLIVNWTSGAPSARIPVAANSSQSTNPTAAQQADLNSFSVEMPAGT
jgi:hypothetical protein